MKTHSNNVTGLFQVKVTEDVALELRLYQQEIVDQARYKNTIAYLPTGSGKTLIACHLISNRIRTLRSVNNGVAQKMIAFIAPTKVLLSQQLVYLEKNCVVEHIKVKEFNGNTKLGKKPIDQWDETHWKEKILDCEVEHTIFSHWDLFDELLNVNTSHIFPYIYRLPV